LFLLYNGKDVGFFIEIGFCKNLWIFAAKIISNPNFYFSRRQMPKFDGQGF